MILTTARIVCLNQKNTAFKAFDLPLALTYNESFEQPIFGANYIKGTCKPLLNLPGDVNFKIWFMEGGCGTFAPAYLKMVHSMRVNRRIDQNMQRNIANGTFNKTAYVDPNDPSIIYLQQPQVVQNMNYNPFGYQTIPQQPIQQPMQQPMYQQPIQQQPMYQQPIQQQPMYQQPIQQQPMYQQPIQQQPMYQQPMQQQPMYQQPMQQQPMYQQPMQQQPMYQQPMQQQQMNQPYMMSQPVSNQNSQVSNEDIMKQREAYYNKLQSNMSQPQIQNQQPQQINNQNQYPIYNNNNINNNMNNNNMNNNNMNNAAPVNEFPSMEQVMGSQNQNLYPQADNVHVLNNVNIQQGNEQNNQAKYFGFFGPNLVKRDNQNQ